MMQLRGYVPVERRPNENEDKNDRGPTVAVLRRHDGLSVAPHPPAEGNKAAVVEVVAKYMHRDEHEMMGSDGASVVSVVAALGSVSRTSASVLGERVSALIKDGNETHVIVLHRNYSARQPIIRAILDAAGTPVTLFSKGKPGCGTWMEVFALDEPLMMVAVDLNNQMSPDYRVLGAREIAVLVEHFGDPATRFPRRTTMDPVMRYLGVPPGAVVQTRDRRTDQVSWTYVVETVEWSADMYADNIHPFVNK